MEKSAAVVIAALNSSKDVQSVTAVGNLVGCSSLESSLGRRSTCTHSVLRYLVEIVSSSCSAVPGRKMLNWPMSTWKCWIM